MKDGFIVSLIFVFLNSIKFLLFGIGEHYNSNFFNFIQFIAFNNHLHFSKERTVNIVSDIFLWIFFGLSPHPNQDTTYRYFQNILNDDDKSSNHSRILREDPYNVNELSDWVNKNKFLLTMISVVFVILVSFLVWIVYYLIATQKLCCQKKSSNSLTEDLIKTRDGSIYRLNTKYISTSYSGFILKVLLIAFCNISSISISQVLTIETTDPGINFLNLCVLIFFVLGFPIFVWYILDNNKTDLYETKFLDRYGSLYLDFKVSNIKFVMIIFLKQILYSILINISERLTILQNSLILTVNFIFLILIMKVQPYNSKPKYYQSLILASGMVIISLINFVLISDLSPNIKNYFTIAYFVCHGLLVLGYGTISIIEFYKRRNKPKILKNSLSYSSGLELLDNKGIDYVIDPEYELHETTRFSESIV
jgi:hypothetical protein